MRRSGNPFYTTYAWKKCRKEVLAADKGECQDCKRRGVYTKAEHVHHEKTIDRYPALALERAYTDASGAHRQLISLCEQCHMKRHDYRHRPKVSAVPEMW